MSAPNVVGLDLSITATGIADHTGDVYTVGGKADLGDFRLCFIRDEAAHHGRYDRPDLNFAPDLVVIEDIPTHAHGAGITAMVHGAVRSSLIDADVPYLLVPPASLKKYATGKGNCGKPEMAVALYKRTGLELADDNQVDAAWLRFLGLDLLGRPEFDLPASHRVVLEKIGPVPS